MKRLLLIICATITLLNLQPTYANLECGKLIIKLSNPTTLLCVRVGYEMKHGDIVTAPPSILKPNENGEFTLAQSTAYGPDITFSYLCGYHTFFEIHAQQNFCSTAGGNMTYKVLNQYDSEIAFTSQQHSGWPSTPGELSAKIERI